EFMQRFLRLAGFLGAAAGTEEEQAKNFQWGLRRSTLNHLMCMSYMDVAHVANAARNYEILLERDDEDTERPDKRQRSGDRHQPTSQQSSHRNHGHNNDRHGSDRRSGGDNHRSNNNYSGSSNRNSDTLFIYGHALFMLFDTGATHSVISFTFASRITTTPTLLDHVLCISTPMQDSVRITHVYRNLPLQFDDKIREINAFPIDMCEFDIILGMDWLTEHHAMIDCHSYRVIFGDIHAPEYTYHGSLPGKSMQIISALQARTLLYHGCEGFLATIHDTTSEVSSIHDQPIVSEFSDVFSDELPGIPPVRERFLRLAGFLGAAAGTEEEQAKNFQWGLRRSTLNHLMYMSYTDVAQVANAARNYEILHERDDGDTERPDKRQRSGDRHQLTSQQSSHRSHGQNNDRQGSDRRGGNDNHRGSSNNNYSGSNNRNSDNGRDQRNRGHQSNRSTNSGVPLRVTPIQFTLLVDVDTKESVVELQVEKKPGASGRVFAITEGQASNTS
nr:hypothetical protein [Tanacetum cinerariifolium]